MTRDITIIEIDLENFEVHNRLALYKNFSLASEPDSFRLTLGEYSGNAVIVLVSGELFSAKDKGLDSHGAKHCAQRFKGDWWYRSCHTSNLNGQYLGGKHYSEADGVNWTYWRGQYYSLKRTVMKIRLIEF
ncbi:techylectin-5A-like [Gigantopelta aegis]|uniref:techylectin-5A-like n=1 Tax=Gigantopelta aegis TaxID=1735272 RepID=UPI001B88DEE6|nr:techylectin-5A-like [Gigantopelta aegis]